MKNVWLLVTCLCASQAMFSQSVSINNTGALPHNSAILDVSSNTRGFLIPRMTTAQVIAIANPAKGLMVFNTTNDELMVNLGTPAAPNWQSLNSSTNGWGLTGNAGTNPASNFIGTADNQRLVFRVNNINAAMLDPITHNSFFGIRAGVNTNGGGRNVAIGASSLFSNQTGSNLVAVGDSALLDNTTGIRNTAIGSKSGMNNTSGSANNFFGYHAGYSNTTGSQITAFGNRALYSNTTGSNNLAIGSNTMALLSGNYDENLAIGDSAAYNLFNGSQNTVIGVRAGAGGSVSSYNTLIGFRAGYYIGGNNNVGIGNATFFSGSGYNNTAIGTEALNRNEGSNNIGIGQLALSDNTDGDDNIGIGEAALLDNITGNRNIGIGQYAGWENESGSSNIAIGSHALRDNIESSYNIAIGDSALLNKNGTVGRNTVVGSKAGYFTTTGSYNCFYGRDAANANTTGSYNVAIGHEAMDETTTADGNVVIGREASSHWSFGNNNTLLGSFTAANADGYSSSVGIGYLNIITASNQVRLGSLFTTSIGGYQNWSNISDGRYKKNIRQNVPGLDFVLALKPVTYNLDVQGLQEKLWVNQSIDENEIRSGENIVQTGFIAQDVEAAAKKLGYAFSGVDVPKNELDMYGLRYAEFVVPLVKAVQEQQVLINDHHKVQEELKKENEALMQRLKQLEEELNKLKQLVSK